MGGYHRPVCVETVVGPLHHSSVEGWGRQQQQVIMVSFNNWEELDWCALLCIISMDSLHPAIPVRVRELRIVGFYHPPRCPECVTWSEEWLIISQGGGELSEGEKHDRVRSNLFPVRKWNNLNFTFSQDLSFGGTAAVVCGSGKGGAGEVTDPTHD